jgi:MFS family permease
VPPLVSAPASLNPFQTLLRHRNFRLFWFGQTLSLVGTWMQAMAEGWLALELSNSPFVVGLVASAASLPILLVSMHAGWFVDRSDKLRIVRIAQTLLGVQAALLWWFTWSGHITVGWLLIFALASGSISAFEIPARQSLVIDLVGREDLPGAIALNSSGFNLARIVGPSIGAIIIAQLGIAWCFGVNALSYITVLAGLFLVRLPTWTPPEKLIAPIDGIREGIHFMRGTPVVALLMGVVAVFSVLGVPYLTMMPVIARDTLGLGAGGYGALLACVGVGGLTGALGLAALGDRVRRGVVLSVASFSYAALLVIFSLVRSAALAYPVLFCVGFAMIATNAVANATLQHLVPNALRGRMMAAYSFINVGLSSVVGSLIAGSVAHVIGASWAVGGGGAILLVFSFWVYRTRPQLRAV